MSYLRRVCTKSHGFTLKLKTKSFTLLALTFRSMIHFDLNFVIMITWGTGSTSLFWMWMWISICPSTICWKDYSFPTEMSWHLCQKSADYKSEGVFLHSHFIPLIYLSCTVLITIGLYTFWTRKCGFSNFLLFQDSFGYPSSLRNLVVKKTQMTKI